MDEKEKLPSWDMKKNIPINGSVDIVLDCAVPIKEGVNKGKFGTTNWHLWFGHVTNQSVYWRDEKREELNYTGKVITFPPDFVNDRLIEICDGNQGVKVRITKTVVEKQGKLFKNFSIEKLEGGTTLSRDEDHYVQDLTNLKKDGIVIKESDAIHMGVSDYKFKEERAKELYKMVM
jgi:hypothetical protein